MHGTSFTDAVVGLERTFYNVSEMVGVMEVCTIVYSPSLPCPVDFPFEVKFSTDDSSAGKMCGIFYTHIILTVWYFYTHYVDCIRIYPTPVTPMDYGAVSTTLTFPACATRACVDIHIVNDIQDEPDETFNITLERTPGLDSRIALDPVDGVFEILDSEFEGKLDSRFCVSPSTYMETCKYMYIHFLRSNINVCAVKASVYNIYNIMSVIE